MLRVSQRRPLLLLPVSNQCHGSLEQFVPPSPNPRDRRLERNVRQDARLAGVGVLFGLVGLAAAGIQMMTGESWVTFYVLFPAASIAITLWITYLGFRMWRMADKGAG